MSQLVVSSGEGQGGPIFNQDRSVCKRYPSFSHPSQRCISVLVLARDHRSWSGKGDSPTLGHSSTLTGTQRVERTNGIILFHSPNSRSDTQQQQFLHVALQSSHTTTPNPPVHPSIQPQEQSSRETEKQNTKTPLVPMLVVGRTSSSTPGIKVESTPALPSLPERERITTLYSQPTPPPPNPSGERERPLPATKSRPQTGSPHYRARRARTARTTCWRPPRRCPCPPPGPTPSGWGCAGRSWAGARAAQTARAWP